MAVVLLPFLLVYENQRKGVCGGRELHIELPPSSSIAGVIKKTTAEGLSALSRPEYRAPPREKVRITRYLEIFVRVAAPDGPSKTVRSLTRI